MWQNAIIITTYVRYFIDSVKFLSNQISCPLVYSGKIWCWKKHDETVALRDLCMYLMGNRKTGDAVPKSTIDRGSDEGIKWLQHSELCGIEVNDDGILQFPVQMRSSWWIKADPILLWFCYTFCCLTV